MCVDYLFCFQLYQPDILLLFFIVNCNNHLKKLFCVNFSVADAEG
jgi:hypothetical protein